MHDNSMKAYNEIKPDLSTKQTMVMAVLRGKTLTRQDIAHLLRWEINQVTGRVKELLDKGMIEECGHRTAPGTKRRALLRVRGQE